MKLCFNRCGKKAKGKQLFCSECKDKPRPKIDHKLVIYDKI